FILLGGFGFPGGAVYIDRASLRSHRWETAVALAGPMGSLACGVLFGLPFLFLGAAPAFFYNHLALVGALAFLVFLEATAILLNLIPIPGLDGWNALSPHLPYEIRNFGYRIGSFGFMILFLLMWTGNLGW